MNRTIEAILKLSAKLGSMAAFNQLAGKMAMVDKQAKAFNRTQGLMAKGSAMAGATMMRYLAPAALTYGAIKTTKAFADVERRMERIGITADASSTQTAAALERIRQTAQAIGAPVDSVMEGMESLVASGKSMNEALAFLPAVAKTAQAADAQFGDIATTADAVGNSFGITADKMEHAFDILAKGGKLGKFELKDMAAELPNLAPAFAALGYKGEEGLKKLTAALQVVRLETGTSAEAATEFGDVIGKMEATSTVANFKKFGVNLRKEMEKARMEGRDLLDFFIELSLKTVKGDLSKLPQLFSDKEMRGGMRALMGHVAELKGYFNELGSAAGTVDADLNRLLRNAETGFVRIGNSWDKLKQSIGEGLVSAGAADLMDSASGRIDKEIAITKAHRKAGRGFAAATWWNTTHSQQQIDALAWGEGYRSVADQRAIEGYRTYGASRAAAPEGPRLPPGAVPVPTARPQDYMRRQRVKDDAFIAPRIVQGSGRTAREEAAAARASLMDAGGWANEADKVAQALKGGGDEAAQKLASGGQEAGKAIGGSADELRAAGDYIAAAIRSAAAGAAAQVRAAGANAVRANVGRSGPQYEGVP